MILTEAEIQQVLDQVKAAFPNLTDWQYNNGENEDYLGFTVWGEFVFEPQNLMSQRFFITFNIYKDKWEGNLTIGLPNYLWSSADMGDAHLLYTEPCTELKEAIAAIKAKIVDLCRSFSAI